MLWHPLFSLLTSLGGSFFGERVVIGMTWKSCQEESRKSMETTPLCPFWTIWKEGNGIFLKEWRIRFFTEKFLHLHHFPLVLSASSTLLSGWVINGGWVSVGFVCLLSTYWCLWYTFVLRVHTLNNNNNNNHSDHSS